MHQQKQAFRSCSHHVVWFQPEHVRPVNLSSKAECVLEILIPGGFFFLSFPPCFRMTQVWYVPVIFSTAEQPISILI